MSSRQGVSGDSPYGFNLGFGVGDDDQRVERNLAAFFRELGISQDAVASMKQVHGDTVTVADEPGVYPSTDAIVTRTDGMALSVRVADCVPILCYVPAHNLAAGIHAGWKGSSLGIAGKTIALLSKEFGVDPLDVFCYIGPAARGCCYEVDPDTADLFDPSVVTRRDGRKPTLDLQAANVRVLQQHGVPLNNIEVEALCTICHPALLHSHRRDRERSGRMLATIALRDTESEAI
jgi:polyphenol oxidase